MRRRVQDSGFGITNVETDISPVIDRATKASGVARFTLHDCRRFFVNRLRQAEVPIDVAMELGGWRSIKTVMAHYRKVDQSEMRQALKRAAKHREKDAEEA